MRIRIVAQEQIQQSVSSIVAETPLLLFADVKSIYLERAKRLKQLALNHPLADYLNFVANIALAQHKVLCASPLPLNITQLLQHLQCNTPLHVANFRREPYWHSLLKALITELKTQYNGQILATLTTLEEMSPQEWEQQADAILQQNFARVYSDKAPFIWAALSLYWAQMAQLLSQQIKVEQSHDRQFCALCGSVPVCGVVHSGSRAGLRYLHCSLCETQWYLERIKCSNCEQTDSLHYYSLDDENAAIKAESCDECGTYIKLLYREKEHKLEAVADELAAIALDIKMEEAGFSRSTVNPFLFPHN